MGRILIVDDSTLMRRIIRSMIESYSDHEVVAEASSADEAIKMFREYSPDLVTMDISLGEVDGIEALKSILSEFPKAKITMISAMNQQDKVVEAIASGAKNYILKPINPSKVKNMLDRIFKNEGTPENSPAPEKPGP
jgi:two-component system, chemotaxis family, chemotaxis protein CheY